MLAEAKAIQEREAATGRMAEAMRQQRATKVLQS